MNPSTVEAYDAYAKRKGFTPDKVTLKDGTIGCWFGDKSAETVAVWFHGTVAIMRW